MDSPMSSAAVVTIHDEADTIIRSFMLEQERIRPPRERRSSVVDQIFRGQGQAVSDQASPHSDVGIQLAEISQRLDEEYFGRETEQNIAYLEQHPENRLTNLRRIVAGVFRAGITPGHVMSLLMFGYRYVHHVINSGIENGEQICRDIIDNIISYIRKYVVSWISSIGGWQNFLDQVRDLVTQYVADRVTPFWERHGTLIGFAFAITAVNLAAIAWSRTK